MKTFPGVSKVAGNHRDGPGRRGQVGQMLRGLLGLYDRDKGLVSNWRKIRSGRVLQLCRHNSGSSLVVLSPGIPGVGREQRHN